jgi:hypothetical protein
MITLHRSYKSGKTWGMEIGPIQILWRSLPSHKRIFVVAFGTKTLIDI